MTSFLILSVLMFAKDSLPIIEIKADRTMIYPQRMELTGEETLMDVLQLVPDLMIAGYEDVVSNYNLRIDNCPMNGDTRLILSQMKAKDIVKIQVCDNTGVAKGTIGTGRVLDINMQMPDSLKGFVEAQGDFGKDVQGIGAANALCGSKTTDLYANASYRHNDGNEIMEMFHLQPSREVGTLKQYLKDAVLDNRVENEREPLMQLLLQKAREMGLTKNNILN